MGLLSSWLESLDYEYNVMDGCVRKKSPKATCTSCIDSCPEHAIEIHGGKPVIFQKACTECGLCMIECPVQAIEGIFPRKSIAGNQLTAENENPLSVTELLILHSKGVTTILAGEELEWKEKIQKANGILAQIGKTPFLVTDSILSTEEDTSFTRRELFSLWGKESKSTVASVTPAKWRFNHSSLELSKYYPDHQFFDVSINEEKCNLCKICLSLCPKDCFHLGDTAFTVYSQPCSNCGLCLDTCPEKAVTVESWIKEADTKTYKVIRKTCPDCHQEFQTVEHEKEKCIVCTNRNSAFLRSQP